MARQLNKKIALFAFMALSSLSLIQADAKTGGGVLDHTMKSIDGKMVDLNKYKGKVVLIVNVASQCGFTPQYKGLQALHAKYGSKGLAILGFPCNNFGRQEPGSDAQIKQFCSSKFGVEFDMFSKINVKGSKKCDLYKFLTSKDTNPKFAGEIRWNFEKFLIGRDGKVIGRYSSRVSPRSKKLLGAVEAALAAK